MHGQECGARQPGSRVAAGQQIERVHTNTFLRVRFGSPLQKKALRTFGNDGQALVHSCCAFPTYGRFSRRNRITLVN
jgi:hypothetical protein